MSKHGKNRGETSVNIGDHVDIGKHAWVNSAKNGKTRVSNGNHR